MSPSGDIMKDSSVSLTCSSDANPPNKYTWYKKNKIPLSEEPQLVFNSIQASDSGEYYCVAKNDLGRHTSEYVSINVKCEWNTFYLSKIQLMTTYVFNNMKCEENY